MALLRSTFTDPLVPGEVPYAVLTPDDRDPAERLPLILLLHGANSSREALTMFQDQPRPRAIIACASTPTVGGFYLGPWEELIATAFPALLAREHGIATDDISLLGSSMGGFGALRIAFADPARWTAVAAIAPALLPAGLPPRNTMGVLGDLAAAMGPTDPVRHRLRQHADAVRASGLPIFLRVGDHDVFKLHDGAEELHRALWDLDIAHDYHLVLGADHVGPEALAAQRAALDFIGSARSTPPSEPAALREMLAPLLAETERRDPDTARRYGRLRAS